MRKQTLVIAAIIIVLIGFGGFILSASAAPGFFGGMMSQEWRQNMRNAKDSNNFDSWKNLMQERHDRMLKWMTPERFSKMNEMRRLMREGKIDDANKIRQELGMPAFQRGEPAWNGKNGMMGKNFSGKSFGRVSGCWR